MHNVENRLRKSLSVYIVLTLLVILCLTFDAAAGTQSVSLSPDKVEVSSNESIKLILVYNVTEGAKQTTGIGLRIHFNSELITSLDLVETYGEGMIAQDEIAKDDIDDFDGDPDTDKYLGIAWVGVNGDWPALIEQPVELGTIILKIQPDTKGTMTQLNITSSSTPVGYVLDPSNAVITTP